MPSMSANLTEEDIKEARRTRAFLVKLNYPNQPQEFDAWWAATFAQNGTAASPAAAATKVSSPKPCEEVSAAESTKTTKSKSRSATIDGQEESTDDHDEPTLHPSQEDDENAKRAKKLKAEEVSAKSGPSSPTATAGLAVGSPTAANTNNATTTTSSGAVANAAAPKESGSSKPESGGKIILQGNVITTTKKTAAEDKKDAHVESEYSDGSDHSNIAVAESKDDTVPDEDLEFDDEVESHPVKPSTGSSSSNNNNNNNNNPPTTRPYDPFSRPRTSESSDSTATLNAPDRLRRQQKMSLLLPVIANHRGFTTTRGLHDEMWDGGKNENVVVAPTFPHGAGFLREEFLDSLNDKVVYVATAPYQKTQAKCKEEVQMLHLPVIYKAGRTGFEEEQEFPIVPGTLIAGQYEIVQYLNSAAFSRAVKCRDKSKNLDVCVKIIRNSKDFFDQSLDEIKLLNLIKSGGSCEKNHVVQLYNYFYYKEHMFLVCELLGKNLYDYANENRKLARQQFYFTLPRLQSIARQVLTALQYIHSLGLIHCDLKPENIVFRSARRCDVRLIDFGSSCYLTDKLSSYVQSRSYRAPEVVLGCRYDGRVDVWSLGAILPELATGNVLFYSKTVSLMLTAMSRYCGPFPASMLHEGRHTRHYVSQHGAFYEYWEEGKELRFHFPQERIYPEEFAGYRDPNYVDFVRQCLTVDYQKRPTAAELLQHPFITTNYGDPFYYPESVVAEADLPYSHNTAPSSSSNNPNTTNSMNTNANTSNVTGTAAAYFPSTSKSTTAQGNVDAMASNGNEDISGKRGGAAVYEEFGAPQPAKKPTAFARDI